MNHLNSKRYEKSVQHKERCKELAKRKTNIWTLASSSILISAETARDRNSPANILFKPNNRNTRKRCEICSQ